MLNSAIEKDEDEWILDTSYYAKYFNSNTTTDEFRLEMEKASGKDLKLFFKQWLYQPINPTINAVWKYDAAAKKLNLQLTQSQSVDFLFNVPVEVGYYKTGSTTPTILKMNLSRQQEVFSFPVPSAPEKLELDPRNVLLNNGNLTKE
jgi:aminopeptidase N